MAEVPANAALLVDRGIPIGNSDNGSGDGRRALQVLPMGGKLVSSPFDAIYASFPDSVTEVYVYKNQGNTVATITVIYTDSTKLELLSAVRT